MEESAIKKLSWSFSSEKSGSDQISSDSDFVQSLSDGYKRFENIYNGENSEHSSKEELFYKELSDEERFLLDEEELSCDEENLEDKMLFKKLNPFDEIKLMDVSNRIDSLKKQIKILILLSKKFLQGRENLLNFYKFYSYTILKELKLFFGRSMQLVLEEETKQKAEDLKKIDQYIQAYLDADCMKNDKNKRLDLKKLVLKKEYDEPTEFEKQISEWCAKLKIVNKKVNDLVSMLKLTEKDYFNCLSSLRIVIDCIKVCQKEAYLLADYLGFEKIEDEAAYFDFLFDGLENRIEVGIEATEEMKDDKLPQAITYQLDVIDRLINEVSKLSPSFEETVNLFDKSIKKMRKEFENEVDEIASLKSKICLYLKAQSEETQDHYKSKIEGCKTFVEQIPNNSRYIMSLARF